MATGSGVGYVPNVPPLFGDFNLEQETAATDHVTLTSATNTAGGAHLVWRTSAGVEQGLITGGGDLILKDSNTLEFGSLSSGAGDVAFAFDGTKLQTTPSTGNTAWYVGGTTAANGMDFRLNSTKLGGGGYVEWDASAGRLSFRKSVAGNRAILNLLGGTTVATTAPTTGLMKGDLFLNGATTSILRLGVCYSAGLVNGIKYITRFNLSIGAAT